MLQVGIIFITLRFWRETKDGWNGFLVDLHSLRGWLLVKYWKKKKKQLGLKGKSWLIISYLFLKEEWLMVLLNWWCELSSFLCGFSTNILRLYWLYVPWKVNFLVYRVKKFISIGLLFTFFFSLKTGDTEVIRSLRIGHPINSFTLERLKSMNYKYDEEESMVWCNHHLKSTSKNSIYKESFMMDVKNIKSCLIILYQLFNKKGWDWNKQLCIPIINVEVWNEII